MQVFDSPYLKDDAPLKHKIVRIIFYLTSFSWTFNPIQDYMGESTPLEKIFTRMIPMIIVAIYCITSEHKWAIKRIFRPGLWALWWYVCIGILSGISNVQPALCVWKGAEIIIALMFVTLSCRDELTTQKELVAFTRLSEILLWVTVFLALINPSLGFRNSPSIIPWIQGYLPILNPNSLGFISALCIIRLLFLPAKYKVVRLLLTSVVLICAQSRTSYAVTFVTLIIFILDAFRTKEYRRMMLGLCFGIIALSLLVGWHETLLAIVLRGESSEELASLSGRMNYWEFASNHVTWFGNGLATGSRSLIFIGEETFHRGSVNLHNSFMEALMGSGYIGAAPFLAFIVINATRQGVSSILRPNVFEIIFTLCAVTFLARSMTSVVLAIFSYDFNNMLILWTWLYTKHLSSTPAPVWEPPKPIFYEKTLHEQSLLQLDQEKRDV